MEWSPPGGEDLDLSPLFHDAMGQLQRRHNDQRLELLLHKAEHSVLDDAEKKELRTLLTTQKSNT
jgi:hypothetical protein